jgi:hypothetical protein
MQMEILSIGKTLSYEGLSIVNCEMSQLSKEVETKAYDAIIISGGDGTIRRVMKTLQDHETLPPFVINATGSFNVIAKMHRVAKLPQVLEALSQKKPHVTKKQKLYGLNEEVFLFSAGNMGDLQHIFLSETLRFGWLKHGMLKYLLATLFLLPVHLIMTPLMLLSSQRFFLFMPARFLSKFGSFRGVIEKPFTIDLQNHYNLIELDGDVVTVEASKLHIKVLREIEILTLP